MEAGEHVYLRAHPPIVDDIEEPVGKAAQNGPPHVAPQFIAIDLLLQRRIGPQMALDTRQFIEEFDAQSLTLRFVGAEGLGDFGSGSRLVDDGCRHCP